MTRSALATRVREVLPPCRALVHGDVEATRERLQPCPLAIETVTSCSSWSASDDRGADLAGADRKTRTSA